MIDVEIRGPVAKKEYERLKAALRETGEAHEEKRVTVIYRGIDAGVLSDLELDYGGQPKIVLKDHRHDRQTTLPLASVELKDMLAFAAGIGYTKGETFVRQVLVARYGGAEFSLIDPLEDEGYYYEASMGAKDPVEAKEAKKKLETLARKFKLPMWTQAERASFFVSLKKRVNYTYGYLGHGAEHFKDKSGI